MKAAVLIFSLFIFLAVIVVAVVIYDKDVKYVTPTVTPTPTPIMPTKTASLTSSCKPNDLQAMITTEGAAGSIYGNLTLKNISKKMCEIKGNNFVSANYTVENITISKQGKAGSTIIKLSPNQTVYSQVRYQNGPQCTSPIKNTNATFSYNITNDDSVVFKNAAGSQNLTITTCTSQTEITQIAVWSMALNPISQ